MKQLKMIRFLSIMIIVFFILFLISHAYLCIRMTYPHPALGIGANSWVDQFLIDLNFILLLFGIPIIFDIITLIVSCILIKKLKTKNQSPKPKLERKED